MQDRSPPDRTRLIVAAVSLGGAVAVAVALLAFPPVLASADLRLCAVLLVMTAVAERVGIRLKHGESAELLTLFELVVVADIVLLPPALAVIVSVAGLALSLVAQRRPFLKFVFNLGQYALGLVPAVAIYHYFGHDDFGSDRGLLALAVGMALFTMLNLLTISAIIAATTDRPLRRVIAEERDLSIALGLGNTAVGMVAVSLYLNRPALLPAVLAPTIALHVAFRGWVQQKELTERMEAETTKLGRIVEHSSEGIVLADGDDIVLLWSPSMERITGVSSQEAVGKALGFLLRGRDQYGRPVTVTTTDAREAREIEIVATDGSARWLRLQHGPGLDRHGHLDFDVVMVTDVTRQREVERLKDDFFSTVSHELRTPLTPIKGYATLLLRRFDEVPADRRREALQSIVDRSDHMARLVEDMLLASRMGGPTERRLPDVTRQPIDVEQVVERAIRPFVLAHPLREIRVDTNGSGMAMADPVRIEQVVASLVSNAIKFSEEAAPVRIEVARDTHEVSVSVHDQGRGIPSDRVQEIFQKFKRLEDPLHMETGGAGLGLFIVEQLVTAMGGTVEVESQVGRGSTFTVRVPAAAGSAAAGEASYQAG